MHISAGSNFALAGILFVIGQPTYCSYSTLCFVTIVLSHRCHGLMQFGLQQAPDKKPGKLLLSKSSQLLLSEQYSPKLKENRFKLKSTIQNLIFKIRATSSSSAGLTRQLRRPACGFGSRELCCAVGGNGLHKVDEKITSIKMFKIIQIKRFARERSSDRGCVARINYHLYHIKLPDKREIQQSSVLTKRDWLTLFISHYCSCKPRVGFSQDLNVHLYCSHVIKWLTLHNHDQSEMTRHPPALTGSKTRGQRLGRKDGKGFYPVRLFPLDRRAIDKFLSCSSRDDNRLTVN